MVAMLVVRRLTREIDEKMNDFERQERRAWWWMAVAFVAAMLAAVAVHFRLSPWFVAVAAGLLFAAFYDWLGVFTRAADGHARATEGREDDE